MVNENREYFDVSAAIDVLEGMPLEKRRDIVKVLEIGEDKGQRIKGYERELRMVLGDRRNNYSIIIEEREDRGTSAFKWYVLVAERIK